MMLELRCECSHMRYWMHEHLGLELSINVQSKNTQNLKQPYRPYLLSASSPAEVRAG